MFLTSCSRSFLYFTLLYVAVSGFDLKLLFIAMLCCTPTAYRPLSCLALPWLAFLCCPLLWFSFLSFFALPSLPLLSFASLCCFHPTSAYLRPVLCPAGSKKPWSRLSRPRGRTTPALSVADKEATVSACVMYRIMLDLFSQIKLDILTGLTAESTHTIHLPLLLMLEQVNSRFGIALSYYLQGWGETYSRSCYCV